MPERLTQNETYQFFIKILFPAFLAVGLKIAIEMKKKSMKVTAFNVLSSVTIGVGGAYICSDWIRSYFEPDRVSIAIALVAILSEKIGEFLIYKLNVDVFLTALIDSIFDFVINLKGKK